VLPDQFSWIWLYSGYIAGNYGGDPYCNPQTSLNALFHILHDLVGTEAGVAIFTWLVYKKGIAESTTNPPEKLPTES